ARTTRFGHRVKRGKRRWGRGERADAELVEKIRQPADAHRAKGRSALRFRPADDIASGQDREGGQQRVDRVGQRRKKGGNRAHAAVSLYQETEVRGPRSEVRPAGSNVSSSFRRRAWRGRGRRDRRAGTAW